jgi:ATP-dependent DNA ligase
VRGLDSLPRRTAEFVKPIECALVAKLPEGPDWTHEIKLDGYRVIVVRTSSETILYSRNNKNFNK